MSWPTPEELREWEDLEVLHRLDHLLLHRELRQKAFRERLERVARWCGREVGGGRLAAVHADRRIDALAHTLDPETPIELFVIPLEAAKAIAADAFRRGLEIGHAELLQRAA